MQWIRPLFVTGSYVGMRAQLRALKQRRDELLNVSVTRDERPEVLDAVREVNRRIALIEERLGRMRRR